MRMMLGLVAALLLLPGMAAGQDPGARLPAIEPPARFPPVDRPITKAIEPGEHLDDLRIVSVDPASGEVASASSDETLTRENSVEVILEYDLVSAPDAVVSAELRAPGAGRITSFEASPNRVYDESGRVRKRLAVSCGPDVSDRIRDLRIHYWMFVPGASPLVDKEQSLPHTVLCDGTESPGLAAKPGERVPDRPVSPPAGRPVDVARPPVIPIDPGVAKRKPPAKIDPGVAERLGACADPAAAELYPRLVGRTDPSRGVGIIEIIGVVRNVGRAAYVSEPRQQSVQLIEEQPGTSPRTVETQSFTSLVPNGTMRLVHRRGWDTGTEFQPRYRLRINYEPDIRADANPRNDDCGLGNNEAVLEPERINALFR